MSRTFRTTDQVKQIINGREVIDAPSYRKQWTASRLVVMPDGTTIPLLYLLAEQKFGAFDPKEKMPFWMDKLCTNEDLENVGLLELSPDHRPRQNSYGVPAGTPEYMKRYRDRNREKVKQYQKNYYTKLRAAYKELQGAEPSSTPSMDKSLDKLLSILPSEAIPEDLDRRKNPDRRENE